MTSFRSVSSSNTDAYRAGAEIGEGLRDFSPEVILLFTSIQFRGDFSDFFIGLKDGLGPSDAVVFGGTGDGIYESQLTAHYGVCALGISSQKKIRWHTAIQTGVEERSEEAAQKCAQDALSQLGSEKPSWAFVLADGMKADGAKIVKGIESVFSFPFLGGLTGDDRKFTCTRVFLNGRDYDNAVAVLLAEGDLSFVMNAASGWSPVGEAGIVEENQGNIIYRISGRTPREFLREQLSKPFGASDLGTVPFATYSKSGEDHFALRSSSRLDDKTGAMTAFGGIEAGTTVRACAASREEILGGVSDALQGALEVPEGPEVLVQKEFTPAAALIVSCAGRKWLLEEPGGEEVRMVQQRLGQELPLVGFPSFGEMGAFRKKDGTYTETYFHNVTFVLCLFGQ